MKDATAARADPAAFIARWQGVAVLPATELATAQSFVSDLCDLLGVPHPHPTEAQDYQFERPITFAHGDGSASSGRIDCYKRSAFVLEAKKLRAPGSQSAFDAALLAARSQAEGYARALPANEGRPPFLIVVDVGRVIELYAEFTRSGGTYAPFPDPRSHRIALADLAKPDLLDRLRAVWLEPLSLDPARVSARVTRAVAAQLAEVARSLEAGADRKPNRKASPKDVAAFLSRCLFTMFAEDVGLLPRRSFVDLLEKYREKPDVLARQLEFLWTNMDGGEFSPLLERTLLKFNGKLFKDRRALHLMPAQIDGLLAAARSDWKQVEPAIFGTLLERALDPDERHALGAHYTPRAYVERLVLPTIVEPLREDWALAQAAALVLAEEAQAALTARAYASESDRERESSRLLEPARKIVREFLHRLANVRVLDPACGSGNFLYVTLEHLKRLEGEVLNQLDELGDAQGRLELAGVTVDPHQLLGIEINPRAAEIAEMVLWIGYLQWHFRTRGDVSPPEPVLKDFRNIEHRDAVLAYDRVEYEMDDAGRPVTRWDGRTMKKHPVTGLDVPNEAVQVPVEKYVNPRAAEWPEADFVVGNPPFIGSKRMRESLGDGYVDALQSAWPTIPEATDFVMRWWHNAALLARAGKLRRFGLITTNTLRQTYVRRAVEPHLTDESPLSLVFAVPDHPWVDSADGAAVRISMTVGEGGKHEGRLIRVVGERDASDTDEDRVTEMRTEGGSIHADLSVGANLTKAVSLTANLGLCSVGMKTIGGAFQIDGALASDLGLGTVTGVDVHIRPYLNGRDWVSTPRGVFVVDFFGLEAQQVQQRFPAAYQHLLVRAKPERDLNRNSIFRDRWWVIGHPRQQFRDATAGLRRYLVTVETQKHRFFGFVDSKIAPDSTLVTFAFDDALSLGVFSSRLHVQWALSTGGRLGVGNDPRYNKSRCFETFPFPVRSEAQSTRIRTLAEQIDVHRKRQQSQHADLTLTGMYNVLEKLRSGETLTTKERTIHDHGLVSVLRELHDDLDRAVFDAYGWNDLAAELVGKPGATTPLPDKAASQAEAEEELLSRLVKLNAERAAEEARGLIRWLRPDYQQKAAGVSAAVQTEIETEDESAAPTAKSAKRAWPKDAPAQAKALADLLAGSPAPLSLDDIAACFTAKGRWRERLGPMLDMLVVLGKARVKSATALARYVRAG